ncbi:MAG TPA: family 43 glycosylhydrolase [Clostridiales bacterium]|nr:family 43 glycosylhydrolase [Clostridiales bacterium]
MSINFKNTRNPILPLEYHVPDGEAHVMPDGRLYVYGSFDDRADVYCSEKYHVVSTPDMEEWTIHDISFEGKDVPWFGDPNAPKYQGIDWTKPTPFIQKMLANMDMAQEKEKFEQKDEAKKPAILFAPDCIYRDGKYYLYFCMPDDSEGVAVSDSPEGPFKNPIQLPCGGIDPAIFIDDDGQAYYYWGQLFSHGVKMNEDMVSLDKTQIVHDLVTEEEHYFHEGSSMRKIGDTYYYVYADMERGKPTSLGYATSKSPLGPFTYRGIIIDNDGCDPASWNNHGSIECVNGRWYVFYHRSSRATQQYRRLCIEQITILEDGSIPEVKMTSQGPGGPFGAGEAIYGYQACGLTGKAYIDADGEGSEWLTNISDGDTAVFRYVQAEKGFQEAVFHTQGSGGIRILLDDMEVGIAKIQENGYHTIKLDCGAADRKQILQELKLVFEDVKELKLVSVVLN